ncbi:Uncharacterised protein [Serratia fonticola]|jgi:IS6 family transposase|nr:Uncharacterised protein [Serratia fonticola]CAI2507905.1 Uncharacterised protein [Serratia fonticola]
MHLKWKNTCAGIGVIQPTCAPWHMDETFVKIRCKWVYLRRAVDCYDRTIDFYLSPCLNTKAAQRFLKKMLSNLRDGE